MERGDIAGVEPIIAVGGVDGFPEVTTNDPWPAYLQIARLHAVAGQDIAVLAYCPQFDPEWHPALAADEVDLLGIAH